MKKRSIALILVLAMTVCLFAACGKKADDNHPSDTSSQNDNSQEGTNNPPSDGDDASGNNTAGEGDGWSWPLTETKTIGIWMPWDCEWNDGPGDLLANQQIERDLNVEINWVSPTSNEASEKFGLMMASGDYPDIIVGVSGRYSGGLTQAYDDGIIIDMTEYIPQYMPTYDALRNSVDSILKDTKSDDGRSISAWVLNSMDGVLVGEKAFDGLVVRKDWLDKLGMDVPTTVDEWYTVLTAFKNEFHCEAPLMIGPDDAVDYCQDFLTAFGVTNAFYNDNGTVKYGPLEEGYRQWIELFRQWYAEGLIDQNFVTNKAYTMVPGDYIGTGRAGAGASIYAYTCDYYKTMGIATDPDFYLVAAPAPVLNEGDTPRIAQNMSNLVSSSISVTTNCQDIELACRFLDFWYTKEGMLYTSYGIEGESYVALDDGTYEFSDGLNALVESGEFPLISEALKGRYCLHNAGFGLYNWYALSVIRKGDPMLDAYDVWNVASTDLVLPARMSMTADELADYNNLYVSLQTLVRENTIKLITGAQSMDTYDQFQADLITYGAQTCIDYQQAALDRYHNR